METVNQPQPGGSGQKIMLPNATAVLVLGICSIVFGCIVIIGLTLGIIGLVLSGKGRKMYKENPNAYDGYGQLNAGFIMSIIGMCLGGLALVYWIIWGLILGTASWQLWNALYQAVAWLIMGLVLAYFVRPRAG